MPVAYSQLVDAMYKFDKLDKQEKVVDCLENLNVFDKKETRQYVVETRNKLTKRVRNGENPVEFMKLLKRLYIMGARDYFEDYLIAVEWDKPYKEKFYLPRRCYLKRIGLIDAYQDLRDGKLDVLTASLPKRAGKSQTGINFVDWLSGQSPERASLVEGTGDDLVDSFYKGCLQYLDPINGYCYSEIFPNAKIVKQKADTHVIDLGAEARFPTIMCRSVDARQVGLSEATNVLYLDDCVDGRKEAKNRALLENKWQVINGDILGRAIEGTPLVATGTRYSIHDPIGKIQQKAADNGLRIKTIEVPALDEVTDESNYEYYNPKLERKVFTTTYFRNERNSLSAEQFESEFQQHPFEAKGILFPRKELNRFFELPVDKDPDSIMAICDTAEGGGDSVMLPIAYIYGEDVFIVDCVFDNSTPEHTKPQCAKKLYEHKVVTATFESNNAGTYYARDVEKMLKEMGGRCSIKTKRTISNKQTRIELASDNILKHFYFLDESLYEKNSQYGLMMKEIYEYTRMGKVEHDDAPDGLSLLENEIREVTNRPSLTVVNRFF